MSHLLLQWATIRNCACVGLQCHSKVVFYWEIFLKMHMDILITWLDKHSLYYWCIICTQPIVSWLLPITKTNWVWGYMAASVFVFVMIYTPWCNIHVISLYAMQMNYCTYHVDLEDVSLNYVAGPKHHVMSLYQSSHKIVHKVFAYTLLTYFNISWTYYCIYTIKVYLCHIYC